MPEHDDFQLLLDACRRREPGAAAELVHRYLPHVQAAVRRWLGVGMRARFDSVDFAQDVWLSFFRAAIDRTDLGDEAALIGYLAQMAKLKVAAEHRHQATQKAGLGRESSLVEVAAAPTGREPTPSAAAQAGDEWERLTAGLPEREREMLRMLRDGHSHADAAAAYGLSEKTVQRLLRRVLGRGAAPGHPQ
jgi:RNA polymerase sigma factor (sigma-70 family)